MRMLYNNEHLETQNFSDDEIVKESIIDAMQFNPRIPSFLYNDVQVREVEDETELIQFGQTKQIDYVNLNQGMQLSSSWTDNLVENPDG